MIGPVTNSAEEQETYALSYRDGNAFYYIPTCPRPANKWRGPFSTEPMMQRAMRDDLGDDVAEIRTVVRPGFLDLANSRRKAECGRGATRSGDDELVRPAVAE